MSVTKLFLTVVVVLVLSFLRFGTCDDFSSTLSHIKPSASAGVQTNAVINLIKRIIPQGAAKFFVRVVPTISQHGKDAFQLISTSNGTVQIIGSTGVAAATAFHYYLKYYCSCHISWEASQLTLPAVLPEINITKTLNDRFRYYQNVCTTSYSFVWWNWAKWEAHIDWIALNSFNLVLAFNGQEAIWQEVYQKLGLTQQEIDSHFAGPAFLSWGRMGNMRGFGGPLTDAWQQRSTALEKKIVNRMREFGIITVLPAFAGYVPRGFKRLYPNENMVKMEAWNHFNDTYCCPYLLDPTSKLFNAVGTLFLSQLVNEFGTDHVYNSDTFNEMAPFTTDLTYLSDVGKAIFKSITDVDQQGIWLLQGWMFYSESYYWFEDRVEAFLTSVPLGKMIVLDLQSEQFPQYGRLQQYFGQPYIWCMLHNFGGTSGMFGSLQIINQVPYDARLETNSTMIGTGLTPEGINQNYIVYDLMTEAAWRDRPANLTEWVAQYVTRRYGQTTPNVLLAWQILKDSVYKFEGIEKMRGKYVITRSPTLNIAVWTWYKSSDLMDAWDLFLSDSNKLNKSSAYLHDLVDITRQVLQVLADEYYQDILTTFKRKDVRSFRDNAEILLDLFDDLEKILETNEAFLLGPWLISARDAGADLEESNLNEYDARNQITLWGPNGEIIDYACKQWAGMISHYYRPRWALFLNYMNESIINATPFNQTEVKSVVFKEVEEPFTFSKTQFPVTPTGDTVAIANKIHEKWWSTMHSEEFENMGEARNLEDNEVLVKGHYDMRFSALNEPEVILKKNKA